MTRSLLAISLLTLSACVSARPSGSLRAVSLGNDPVYLPAEYVTAVYGDHDSAETSFILADVPVAQLLSGEVDCANIVHLDLLWSPEPGATPMDRSATNVSIRYIVFADGEVGVYGGAGFALPHGKTGRQRLTLSLRDASMTLLDSSDGFVDLLSPARLDGKFTADLDDFRTKQIQYAVSQLVTDALGHTRIVRNAAKPEKQAAARTAAWSFSFRSVS